MGATYGAVLPDAVLAPAPADAPSRDAYALPPGLDAGGAPGAEPDAAADAPAPRGAATTTAQRYAAYRLRAAQGEARGWQG
jgi:hypothetical protein